VSPQPEEDAGEADAESDESEGRCTVQSVRNLSFVSNQIVHRVQKKTLYFPFIHGETSSFVTPENNSMSVSGLWPHPMARSCAKFDVKYAGNPNFLCCVPQSKKVT